jgi:hypothetical protein
MRKVLLTMSIALLTLHLQGQDAAPPAAGPSPLRLGVGLCMVTPQGDLSHGEANIRMTASANVSLQFATTKLLSPQLNAGFGRVIAQDRDLGPTEGVQPNTFAQTPFFYVDFRLKAKFLRETRVNPYFSLGIGLLGYTPRDAEGNALIDNLDSRAEGELYGNMTASFPISIGTELKVSDQLRVFTEYTFRPTASDYLDNVGQLGTVKGKDKLHQLQLGLLFTLGH